YPFDPDNTYWWGYSNTMSSESNGAVPNYTQRRVLHLVDWVLRTYPGADANRVYLSGGSMGGTGAVTMGLLYARHFAYVQSAVGQMVPRNHRPERLAQLEGFWGSVVDNAFDGTSLENGLDMGVWDRQDVNRILRDMPEARDQFLFTKHSKDDRTINFGAVTHESPITHRSYYDTVQQQRVGHYAIWDEGGHNVPDPVMGRVWWDGGSGSLSAALFDLRLDRAFPAFSRASNNWDPGDGGSNGLRDWDSDSGYAGLVEAPGDTGWTGDIAGALNRFLRWDAASIVDEWGRFEVTLFVIDKKGAEPPMAGYPSRGDLFDGQVPVTVDVTPRRVKAFRCVHGESVRWAFGQLSGMAIASEDGSVTIEQLPLSTTPNKLVLTRDMDSVAFGYPLER
ncbi:MAG: alpha/beta hydrolase-fold protein, partial [Polyangiaceae bacterium]|nr:alpha/beta hydrolase-fold protein [Polyangiaceae bacterium]